MVFFGIVVTGSVGVWIGSLHNHRAVAPVAAMAHGARVAPDAKGFARVFEKELGVPQWDGVAVSMVVLDEDGEIWFAPPFAGTAMCPASELKVLTTGAALGMLGPEFRFEM